MELSVGQRFETTRWSGIYSHVDHFQSQTQSTSVCLEGLLETSDFLFAVQDPFDCSDPASAQFNQHRFDLGGDIAAVCDDAQDLHSQLLR